MKLYAYIAILFSRWQVSGACWYVLSVGRLESCWRMACNQEKPSCQYDFFDCRRVQDPARVSWYGSTNVTSLCDGSSTNSPIEFGIYAVAVTNSLASCKFFSKFLYGLWWGINNLRYALGCWPHFHCVCTTSIDTLHSGNEQCTFTRSIQEYQCWCENHLFPGTLLDNLTFVL